MNGKRPTIYSRHGMVAAAHPVAASAGAKILASGGNAFDAVVAVASTLSVVEPFMSGLAGMGLATCWVASESRARTLNFVPPIHKEFPYRKFSDREEVRRGAQAVGTPGNLAGWAELNKRYGKLSFGDCLQSAIAVARDGYGITEFNEFETNVTSPEIARYPALYAPWAENYTDGYGKVRLGWVLKQPDLAKTYETISVRGPEHLYAGALGKAMVEHLYENGGSVTMADLGAFATNIADSWRDPITARYRDLKVNLPPPPCEGFQMLSALRILDGFDLGALENNGIEHVDIVLRAIRLAAGERIAHNNPSPTKLAELLSEDHIARLRAKVRSGDTIDGPTEQWMGMPATEHHTTSMSIGDGDGNLVCLTNSLGSPYGAAVIVPGTGVTLNNFMHWADVQPDSPHRAKPGDALPICMAPTISTRDGAAVLALGTPGSYGILQTQVQALVQCVDFDHPLQQAIEQPRIRLWDGRQIEPETRLAPDVLAGLAERGHTIIPSEDWVMRVGGMQGVTRDPSTGLMSGGCDPRRDGYVVPV
ncbi:gamma-glutamyltransferase family protein [Bradyrhizobium sp. CCGUVB14]|uniref:gamma-glutamyltransferase family protein n=1 Tax=Bradyrhizobium sp. CCGUVB14 TaxID=2949628 RepID=UPI0020B2D8DA|nr:gamma-glutamyltransferase [Bradyrhizobium sp. CCGUVB14]MCP3442303.1 gamma-glutamyltransferase [Bradyrhizobium sp. CCGUVB14]